MVNLLKAYEDKELAKLLSNKSIPEFRSGDVVKVGVKIIEDGKSERVQYFEGLVIARRNAGVNSAFTVRRISHGEGVERVFPLYSNYIESIKLVRRGDVRRAKLYYMRDLSGKAARIKEKRVVQIVGDNNPKNTDSNDSDKKGAKEASTNEL